MLKQKAQNLTDFLRNETKTLQARPQRLEQALAKLRAQGSALDQEIPRISVEDSDSRRDELTKKIAKITEGTPERPDKKFLNDLNDLAYYLTSPYIELGWIGRANRAIFSALYSVADNPRYRSTIRHLLYGYIEFFDPKNSLTKKVARYITQNQKNLSKRWSRRVSQFGLLDHPNLIRNLGTETVKALPANFFVHEMSFPNVFESSKVRMLSLRASCELLARSSLDSGKHDQFLNTYFPENNLPRNTAGFLLEPIIGWFKNAELQNSALKQRVQSVLLESFGDPRMQGGLNSWPPLYLDKDDSKKRACQDKLIRWLTKDTLILFFKAIQKTAEQGSNSTALRHWQQRQEFWWRYLTKGHIDQAWVILGDRVSQQLDSLSSNDGLEIIKYGRFEAADNAAIIMRVGQSATVVEWSHNGAVWVCPNKHRAVPKMFSTGTYQDSELRAPRTESSATHAVRTDKIVRITHDVHKSWRAKLDSAIYDLNGVQLPDRHHQAFANRR